ncbi:MAG: HAD-IA family hydrolase [Armatimonadetes bacterium]|nr:HAD-IA family hydrolase [Armatimonadota bacterium]
MLDITPFEALMSDCYGTLIDWETGIWNALRDPLAAHGAVLAKDDALVLYGALESEIEHGPYVDYKTVLGRVLDGFGAGLDVTPTTEERTRFAASVRDWPAFPDSPAALRVLQKKYKLAIVSNVDDDLFAQSAARLETSFNWVITAQQIGSYKPSPANFHAALARLALRKEQILHVAQSLYHDIAPAKTLSFTTVLVNRRHGLPGSGAMSPADARPDLAVPDLPALARRAAVA